MPLALLTALLLIGSICGLVWLADHQTATAIGEQARLARAAIEVDGESLAKGASDYGRWHDAVANVIDVFNFQWVDANIGLAGEDSYGLSMSFILDPEDRTVYSFVDGKGGALDARSVLSNVFNEIVARARADDHLTASYGLVTARDQVAMVAAAPVRPFEDEGRPQDTGYLIVFVDIFNEARLAKLGHTYLLPNLRLVDIEDESIDRRARIRISFSRNRYSRRGDEKIESYTANGLSDNRRGQPASRPGNKIGDLTVQSVDDFACKDAVTTLGLDDQGIRILFEGGSRVVFRFSSTGASARCTFGKVT